MSERSDVGMSPGEPSLPADYFDRMYAAAADPWSLASRWYEQRKYALTLAALPRRRYRRGFEPGCSVGVLTSLLATRCDALLATDVAPAALQATRHRLAATGNEGTVELVQWALGSPWPAGSFDLIVLSEVGYYLDAVTLRGCLDAAAVALEPGGTLLCVHWRHPVADYPQTGDAVHAAARSTPGLAVTGSWADTDFLLDVFTRVPPPPQSVAAQEGLA